MRSYWINISPIINDCCLYKKKKTEMQTDTEEGGHVNRSQDSGDALACKPKKTSNHQKLGQDTE